MNLEDRIPAGAVSANPGGVIRGASYGRGSSGAAGGGESSSTRVGDSDGTVEYESRDVRPDNANPNPSLRTIPVSLSENNMDTPEHQALYAAGYEMRNRVVGPDYVSRSLAANSSDFTRPLQQFATESAWGTIWTRPGLSPRDRSLLNLVMLTALGKWIELGTHVRGAVRNGCSEVEIREALLQASAYCGLPAGMEAFRVADRVLNEMQEKGEIVRD